MIINKDAERSRASNYSHGERSRTTHTKQHQSACTELVAEHQITVMVSAVEPPTPSNIKVLALSSDEVRRTELAEV